MAIEADQLEPKRGHSLRGALNRRTKMQGAIEELRALYFVQQAELERLTAAGSKPDQPTAPTPPGLTRESSAGTASPKWDDIFRKQENGGGRAIRRRLRRLKG